ncbi:hypothetical protein OG698_01265 [Streptomyces sp. NBC_01003]|uniref:hypothetical protein n=1 Tax=Streptomyces sp. NBC_01003 TaxID=2903714 RepID=UPI0038656DAF|nr:hypothetical protein OG698_01265 [Streptomyces sp. NBC_01003]
MLAAAGGPGADQGAWEGPDLRVVEDAQEVPGGDDDEDEECEAAFPGDDTAPVDEDDFYSDAMDSR